MVLPRCGSGICVHSPTGLFLYLSLAFVCANHAICVRPCCSIAAAAICAIRGGRDVRVLPRETSTWWPPSPGRTLFHWLRDASVSVVACEQREGLTPQSQTILKHYTGWDPEPARSEWIDILGELLFYIFASSSANQPV
eukprot:TRINITY_DN20333_c0_g1_i1.p2 TRINITY_DN20333_c0_g1~~TRINITY_DN20333_c0_g1_i1.p2  ORF type:complete len:139 (+),score=9.50 TRINITY_DN20333_c0_g1_i1:82-498(+)